MKRGIRNECVPQVLRTGQAHTGRSVADATVQIPFVAVSAKQEEVIEDNRKLVLEHEL